MLARSMVGVVIACCVLACGGGTEIDGSGGSGSGAAGGGPGSGGTASGGAGQGGDAGQGGAQPDATCMDLCVHPAYSCSGPDLEAGSGSTSNVTATGCTFDVMLATSGNLTIELDCVTQQACVTAGSAGCAGVMGECYDVSLETDALSYMLPNCINGSLSCTKVFP